MTNPRENCYGVAIHPGELGWSTLSFLYSFGGRAVEKNRSETNGLVAND